MAFLVKFPRSTSTLHATLVLLASLGICWGCGGGGYRERMKQRLEELRAEEAAQAKVTPDMLYEYIPYQFGQIAIADMRVNLRAPRIFSQNDLVIHELSESGGGDGKTYSPERVWPLGVKLPGYAWTYEGRAPDSAKTPYEVQDRSFAEGEKRWAFSFYIAGAEIPEGEYQGELEQFFRALNVRLIKEAGSEASQFSLERMQKVLLDNPESEEPRQWQKMRVEAELPFQSFEGNNPLGFEKKPGAIEVYLTYDRGYLVMLAAKWTKATEQSTLMPEFLEAVAASVKIDAEGHGLPETTVE